MSKISHCPRCNEKAFEKLSTHAYCICCGYSPETVVYRKDPVENVILPQWAREALMQRGDLPSIKVSFKREGN